MKQIVFLAVDYGIDGRAPMSIRYASLSEEERDGWIEQSPNKAWLSKAEQIHDLAKTASDAWDKLDPVQRLAIQMWLR